MRATDGRVSLLQRYVKLLLTAAAGQGVGASTAVASPHHRAVALQRAMRQLPELLRLVSSGEAEAAAAAATGLAADISRLMAAAGLEPGPEPMQPAGAGQPCAPELSLGAGMKPPPMHPAAGVLKQHGAAAGGAAPQQHLAAPPPPSMEEGRPSDSPANGGPAAASCADQPQGGGLGTDRFGCGPDTAGDTAKAGAGVLPGPPGGDGVAAVGLNARESLQSRTVPVAEEPSQQQQEGSGESLPALDQLFDSSSENTGDLDLMDGDLLDLINLCRRSRQAPRACRRRPFRRPEGASSMAAASPTSPGVAFSGVDAAAAALHVVCLAASPEVQQSLVAPDGCGATVASVAPAALLGRAVSAAAPVADEAVSGNSACRLARPQGVDVQPGGAAQTGSRDGSQPALNIPVGSPALFEVEQLSMRDKPPAHPPHGAQQLQPAQPQPHVRHDHRQPDAAASASGLQERGRPDTDATPHTAEPYGTPWPPTAGPSGDGCWPAEGQAGAWSAAAAALPQQQPPHCAPVHSDDQARQYSRAQWRPQGPAAGAAAWQADQRPEERWAGAQANQGYTGTLHRTLPPVVEAPAAAGAPASYGGHLEAPVPRGLVGGPLQAPHQEWEQPQPQAPHHQPGYQQGYPQHLQHQQPGRVPQELEHGWSLESHHHVPRQGPPAAPGSASSDLHNSHAGQLPLLASRDSTIAGEAHGPNSLAQWLPSTSMPGHKSVSASGEQPGQLNHDQSAATLQSSGGPGTGLQQQQQQQHHHHHHHQQQQQQQQQGQQQQGHQHHHPQHRQLSGHDAGGQAMLCSSSSCDGVPMQHEAARGAGSLHPAAPLQHAAHDASYMLRLSSPGYTSYTARAQAGPTAASGAGAAAPAGPQPERHAETSLSGWRQAANGTTASAPLDASGRPSGPVGAASAQALNQVHQHRHSHQGQQGQPQARQQMYRGPPQSQHHHLAQGAPPPPALLQARRSAPALGEEAHGRGAPAPGLQPHGPSMPGMPGMAQPQQQQAEWRCQLDGQQQDVERQQLHAPLHQEDRRHGPGMTQSSDSHGATGHDDRGLQLRRHAASCSGALSLHPGGVMSSAATAPASSSAVALSSGAAPGSGMPAASAEAEAAQRCVRPGLRGVSWCGTRQGFASHPASPVTGGCETQGKRPASWLYEDMVGERLPLDDQHSARLQQRLHAPDGSGAARGLGRAYSALIGAERATAAVAAPPSCGPARSCDGVAFSPPLGAQAADGWGGAGGAQAATQQRSGVAGAGTVAHSGPQAPRIVSIFAQSVSAAGCGTESWEYGSDASPASNNYCSSASARPPWDALGSGAHSATAGRASGRDSRRRLLEGHRAASPLEAGSSGSGPASGADLRQLTGSASGSGAPCYHPARNSFAQPGPGHGRLSSCQSAPFEWTNPMELDGLVGGAPPAPDPMGRDRVDRGIRHGAPAHDPGQGPGRQAAPGAAYPGLRSAPQDWYAGQQELFAEIDMMAEAGIGSPGRAVKRSCSRSATASGNERLAFSGFTGVHGSSSSGAVDGSAMGAPVPGALAAHGSGGAGGGDHSFGATAGAPAAAPVSSAAADAALASGPAPMSGGVRMSSIDGSDRQGAAEATGIMERGWGAGSGGGGPVAAGPATGADRPVVVSMQYQGRAMAAVREAGDQDVGVSPTVPGVSQQQAAPPPQRQHQQRPEVAWAAAQSDEAPGSRQPGAWQPQPQPHQVHPQPQPQQYHSQHTLQLVPNQRGGGGAGSWAQPPTAGGPPTANASGLDNFGSWRGADTQAGRAGPRYGGDGITGHGDVAGGRGWGPGVAAASVGSFGVGSVGVGYPKGSPGDDDAHELTFSVRSLAKAALESADARPAPQQVGVPPPQQYQQHSRQPWQPQQQQQYQQQQQQQQQYRYQPQHPEQQQPPQQQQQQPQQYQYQQQQYQQQQLERHGHAQPAQNVHHEQAAYVPGATAGSGQGSGAPGVREGTGAPGFSFASSQATYNGHGGHGYQGA
ncbi:hypothetical protein HXX76_007724 [Chlamydomonas incerta]|uniref:Uncharacterized protein n=1 Tax=Chlamydomonas incerta TaxID=51695 RepID=A0A835T6Q5_CHLIN|nr:hypothetical protein HXX76_007724 [Chlamydomonas incerta]|eukprot:KAG2434839.1 hypothetical protein HXX76_007724 [Chlamydomonas incerta]